MAKIAEDIKVRDAFNKVKEDVEGLKDELAFTLKRISQLENTIIKNAISRPKVVKAKKKKRKKKETWNEHLKKVRKKHPKKTLKECMKIASKSWKKKKAKK